MWKSVCKATLLAGSLDILAATLQAYFMSGTTPDIVLKYIASGAVGQGAFVGGWEMVLLGLLFHFTITFACALTFFLVYPKLKFLHHRIWFDAATIGLIGWSVTTMAVVPLSRITPSPLELLHTLLAIGILILCIGLPIAFLTIRHYGNPIERE